MSRLVLINTSIGILAFWSHLKDEIRKYKAKQALPLSDMRKDFQAYENLASTASQDQESNWLAMFHLGKWLINRCTGVYIHNNKRDMCNH